MTTLRIRSHSDSSIETVLVRDVCHTHPDWVHAQLGTDSEAAIQEFLDCCNLKEFAANAGQADAAGVYLPADGAIDYLVEIGAEKLDADEAPTVAALLSAGKTLEEIAEAVGGKVIQGVLIPEPQKIWVNDGNAEIEFSGLSRDEAAQDYVDGGDWGEIAETMWVDVYTYRYGFNSDGYWDEYLKQSHTITVDPPEPECTEGQHDWQSPYEVLGGLRENPGVSGHGGGAIITEVCAHCGVYQVTDTWAQNPATGVQGLWSVEYRDADDDSLAWVAGLRSGRGPALGWGCRSD